nr:SDR family NAD(P)-dependent oxidoreductase [Streptomyces acidicola]
MSDDGLLAGQVALVTGAGGGIGRGIALRFAAAGASVALHHWARGVDDLVAGVRESGGRAIALRADLTDEDACARLVRDAAEWGGGRLTALVNNAGVQPVQALPGMTVSDWRSVVDTNLSSVFACTQAAAEVMRASGSGSVTHIASIEAGRPAPLHAHYCAAKAAVVMHAALGGAGVRAVRHPRQHRLSGTDRPGRAGGGLAGGCLTLATGRPHGAVGPSRGCRRRLRLPRLTDGGGGPPGSLRAGGGSPGTTSWWTAGCRRGRPGEANAGRLHPVVPEHAARLSTRPSPSVCIRQPCTTDPET